MARIIFKIETTSKTMSQLARGVIREGSKVWTGRALAHASDISRGIGNMLVSKFNNTLVAKALRGNGGDDLPAHFGLTDSQAGGLADGMAELIRTSVHIIRRGKDKNLSIRIKAVNADWNSYLSLPGAQYVSYPSKITIPVLKWLLIDPTIDIGQASYDIVFSGEDPKLDVSIQKYSRSGRAIMVSLKALGGGGGYVLPAIISGQHGENFIEMALGQEGVAIESAIILLKKVR